jgi:hypothetical protein
MTVVESSMFVCVGKRSLVGWRSPSSRSLVPGVAASQAEPCTDEADQSDDEGADAVLDVFVDASCLMAWEEGRQAIRRLREVDDGNDDEQDSQYREGGDEGWAPRCGWRRAGHVGPIGVGAAVGGSDDQANRMMQMTPAMRL